jgi:four helix bundle protein
MTEVKRGDGGETVMNEDVMWVCDGRVPYGAPRSHRDLRVYQTGFQLALRVYELTKRLPSDERFCLIPQARRSSRSVCANTAEAWRKRRYQAAFVAKLSDAETEAGETQVWLEFVAATWPELRSDAETLWEAYDSLIGSLVGMIHHADKWVLPSNRP